MATIKSEVKGRIKPPKKGDKLWLSKYAISRGLEEIVVESVDGVMITAKGSGSTYEMDKDLHATEAEAIAAAKDAVRKKIVATEKALIALRNIKFKPR